MQSASVVVVEFEIFTKNNNPPQASDFENNIHTINCILIELLVMIIIREGHLAIWHPDIPSKTPNIPQV